MGDWAGRQPPDVGRITAARLVATGLACTGAMAVARAAGATERPPTIPALWLAGFVFWLAALYWLTLPHWATSFGWLALSFYLAFYIPVFVGLTHVAVHRLGISLLVAAPIVWTGLELAKGHLLSGFTMGSLGHTQFRFLPFIQIADIISGYGVGGLVILGGACLARMIPWNGRRWAIWPLAPLTAMFAVTLVYGYQRLASAPCAIPRLLASRHPRVDRYHNEAGSDRLSSYSQRLYAALSGGGRRVGPRGNDAPRSDRLARDNVSRHAHLLRARCKTSRRRRPASRPPKRSHKSRS